MSTMVRATRSKSAATAVDITEDVPVATDDVYEPEAETAETEPAKRGRKADPLVAAMAEVKAAKAAVEVSRKAVPLDVAEARYADAKAALTELL